MRSPESAALDPGSVRAIVAHMNDDHAEALAACARAFADTPEGTAVRMRGIDRHGIVLACGEAPAATELRIDFPEPLADARAARPALVELTREARARLARRPGG